MRTNLLFILMLLMQPLSAQKSDVNTLLQKLTLEEKVKLVVGQGMDMSAITGGGAVVGASEEKVPGAAGTSFPLEHLNIPAIVFADGPAGVRINPVRKETPDKRYYATAFPVATVLASTFNVDVVQQVGNAFGNECKEYGVDILLAPALNIHRNPLGGRNFEYYSEDPLLSGKIAAAFTKGVQKEGIGVSIKHFAANNQETNRTQVNTIVSERAMREIYLKGFEIAVKEANPWTVMSSYNKINDVYTSERKDLLTNILRNEWGFKGFVMTDWFGGKNTVEQVKAGNDMLMPGSQQQQTDIINAIKDGSLSMADLDRNVARILTVYFKTQSYNNYKPSGVPQLQVNKDVSQQAAEEGMVLLRNEKQTLPIQPNTGEIALYGIASYRTISGGTGSGDVNKAYSVSIAEGLKKAGYSINSSLEKIFNTYIDVQKSQQKPKKVFFLPDEVIEELDCTEAQLDEDAAKCAVGIFTISRSSGEFFDRKEDNDFNLKKNELQFIQKLSTAFHKQHKPVIILLNIGGVIETSSWKNLADAILLVWQPGQEAGNAVANILSGKVNPSGKLPTTFPVKYNDVYSSKNFPGRQLDSSQAPNIFTGVPSEVIYEEDIFVGYRYFETLYVIPSYSFGYGLSYSTFAFSDMQVEQTADGNFTVSCNITNSGKVDGKEVVQLYISAPDGKLKKPAKELKAFAKTKLLKPGEKQSFNFTLTPYELSSFDSNNSEWILEKGKYTFSIGSSIADVPLSQVITKTETVSVLKTSKSLTPTRIINGLK